MRPLSEITAQRIAGIADASGITEAQVVNNTARLMLAVGTLRLT